MRRSLVVVLVILIGIFMAFPTAMAQKYGGSLTISVPNSPPSLDPAYMEHGEEYIFAEAVYNRLTRMLPDFSVEPELAKSWDVSEDAKTWTFYLREDVKWHDGQDLTAEDVVFVFERMLHPDTGSVMREILGAVNEVKMVDDYTLSFHLDIGMADLPVLLADPKASIYPKHNVENLRRDPIGSGPFIFLDYLVGDRVDFERNDNYWQEGLPYLDSFIIRVQPDPVAALNALLTGEVDVIWNARIEHAQVIDGHPETQWLETASPGFNNMYMMTTEEPFDDNRVRLALKYTIDREAFVDAALGGHGIPANDHPVPPFSEYALDIPLREQDYDKARQLLKEAGYPDGIEITLHTSESRWGQLESAVVLQQMARPAGIEIELVNLDPTTFWADYWKVEPFLVSNWFGRATVHQTLYPYMHSTGVWNFAHFHHPRLDELLDKGMAEVNEERRIEIYQEAQQILYDEGPWLLPYFKNYPVALRNEVMDYPLYPNQWVNLHHVYIDQ